MPIKVDISDIAVNGTSVYTRSCDESRRLTAGAIIYYRRRNSVFVSTRHSVDDEKACRKFQNFAEERK